MHRRQRPPVGDCLPAAGAQLADQLVEPSTVAGNSSGPPPVDGQEAINPRFSGPTGVAVDANGAFYFAESSLGSGTGLARGVSRIWKVGASGILSTLAGNGTLAVANDALAHSR